jgi:hypothetical protein
VDLPVVADFTLGLSQMQAGKDGVTAVRRPAPKPNEFFKVSLCKHFMNGDCPFGEGCHFAHGEHDLRKFPKPGQEGRGGEADGEKELSDNMFGSQETTTVDYYQGGVAGGGKPSPILEPETASFFIVRAATYRDCSISTNRGEWFVQRKHAETLNSAYNQSRQIMIFFTVGDSHHIQGAALVTSMATYVKSVDHKQASHSEAVADCDGPFCYRLQCVWYRTCELPVSTALDASK